MNKNKIIKLNSIQECDSFLFIADNRTKAYEANLIYFQLPDKSAYVSKNKFGKHGIVSEQEINTFLDFAEKFE